MCLSPKVPKLPEKPKVPTREDATQRAEEELRNRLRGRLGRRGTVATTALGDPNFATQAQATRLGGQ